MDKRKQEQFNELVKIAEQNKWTVVSNYYENNVTKMKFECPFGHIKEITPATFKKKPVCSVCPSTAEINFISSIENMGGIVVGKYKNSYTKVDCLCLNNHNCSPLPSSIRKGRAMCTMCSHRSSLLSQQEFFNSIKKLGGIVVGNYINISTKVDCLCPAGHQCAPTPNSIQRGQGMCLECVGRSPIVSEKNFVENIKNMGGIVVGNYVNSRDKVECLCPLGHICFPTPACIKNGQGMCFDCSGRSPNIGLKNFKEGISKQGGQILGEYVNSRTKVKCLCSKNHICYPTPNCIKSKQGMCLECVEHSSEVSYQNFKDIITSQGGEIIGKYINCYSKIECICKGKHILHVSPVYVKYKGFRCIICDGKYISYGEKLTSEALDVLKIKYKPQASHPLLRRLLFDFHFHLNNKNYYIEYDGEQHFKEYGFFHPTHEYFEQCRERDLLKNYVINLDSDSVLIRIDYGWSKNRKPSYRAILIENLAKYIQRCINSNDKIIADSNLYHWVNDKPSQLTINKYYINSKVNLTINDMDSNVDFDDSLDDIHFEDSDLDESSDDGVDL